MEVMLRLLRSLSSVLLVVLAIAPSSAGAAPTPAMPSCAEGPARVGDAIEGTPCADTIVVPPGVASVNGGRGNDTIVPGPITATSSCPEGCRLGVGSQTFEGGPGDDVVFGERGNDKLFGGGGNDKLFGGPGDDLLQGGSGDDLLIGGFGADTIDGEEGSDYVRGDATIDHLRDAGPASDVDTLSYSTGVSPGFTRAVTNPGFPAKTEEGRGVYLDLSEGLGDNGVAPNGGGVDDVAGADFERIVGSPFSDYIKGSKAGQTIYGGGGADVLVAGGSGTTLNGGADGDDCVGGASNSGCESTASNGLVATRPADKVSVGSMTEGQGAYSELYLLGSGGGDGLTVEPTSGAPGGAVTLELTGGGSFEAPPAASGCVLQDSSTAVCTLSGRLASVLVAGLGGADVLRAEGLPATTSLMMLGGEGNDELTAGNESDDILADGPGSDTLHGRGGDDAVLGNAGHDALYGEGGNDLFLSNSICEGDTIEGGAGRDNASWAKFGEGVGVNLATGQAGRPGAGATPSCSSGSLDSLHEVEDLEGSGSPDTFYGDTGPNQLLGHDGADSYYAGAGEDLILANASDADAVIDCGGDADIAIVDFAQFGDPPPVECETVIEAAADNFNLPPPEVTPPPETTQPSKPQRTPPPQTRLGRHPPKLLVIRAARRRVAFRFVSSKPGSHFVCRLDTLPFRRCTSPRTYVVGAGRHTFRVIAIDSAGKADPTPALFRFRVKRR
ncbi:MAG TPA: calcium-binding protein [Solirubrobacterales bacterium]|nr:calcium-binding protein [Solirubrobacterales bacterium]